MSSPRLTALRQLAEEAQLERRDFLYEATEQLRRFFDDQRDRLREIGPIRLVDDEQDYLVYNPMEESWTTRLTYQDPADGEWYDQEQTVETFAEIVELYNPADVLAWIVEAARNPTEHLMAADELAKDEQAVSDEEDDWQRELPVEQQERLAAQRLWQLADAYRTQIQAQQKQVLGEFASNAEEVLRRTGDLQLLDEHEDQLWLRADGRFETSLDVTEAGHPAGHLPDPVRPGMTVTDARVIADYYDASDVLGWVTDALAERYPAVDFTAVYE